MKKFFYFLLALPLVFAACNKTTDPDPKPVVKDPVLNVTETTIDIAAEGGEGIINYTVENAVEGTEVTATCAAEWVLDLTVAETITFSVEANEGEAREAAIVVAYGDLQKSVAVKQAAKAEEPKTPVFEAVTAEVEYDWNVTMGEVEYKLENPIDGVSVTAKASALWISQVQVKDGKIMFAMTENTGEAREGKITAEYGMLEPIEFTVKQGAYVAPDPVLTIVEESVELAWDATTGSFTYTVENAVEGTEAVATTDAEWISNIVAANGTVTFDVTANTTAVREAVVTLTYGVASDTIVVKQMFEGQNPDLNYYNYNLIELSAQGRTSDIWDITLVENHPDLGTPFTRISVKLAEDNAMHITDGTYTVADGGILVNSATAAGNSTWRYNSSSADITDASLTIVNDKENSTSTITGWFQVGSDVYAFEYTGAVTGFMYEELGDEGVTSWTSFTSRYSFDDCYVLNGQAAGFSLEFFIHELGASKDTHGTVPKPGTYPVLDWVLSTTQSYCEGANNGGSKVNGNYLKSEGQVVIEQLSDGYKISFEVVDVNGNAWKGTYTGAL